MTKKIIFPVIFLLVLGLSGCGWWTNVKEWWRPADMSKATPEGLYKRGAEQYQAGRYKKAAEAFQRVKEQYPLHNLALNAELGIADSHFSDESYIEAEMAYSDFINLHPTNENLPYAMYQLGMCHYKQMASIDRDQTETIKARKEFERLIARFPSSKFSFLAEKQALECRKRLAEKEFYVGNFYFIQRKYKAALGRFETIAKEYPRTGLDYKVSYFIGESKKLLILQEAAEKVKKEKEEKETKAREEKEAKAKAAKSAKDTKAPVSKDMRETKNAAGIKTATDTKTTTATETTTEVKPTSDKN
jgi:outer membrane protein assembly factor BamD